MTKAKEVKTEVAEQAANMAAEEGLGDGDKVTEVQDQAAGDTAEESAAGTELPDDVPIGGAPVEQAQWPASGGG